jgi:hypothetical protein
VRDDAESPGNVARRLELARVPLTVADGQRKQPEPLGLGD